MSDEQIAVAVRYHAPKPGAHGAHIGFDHLYVKGTFTKDGHTITRSGGPLCMQNTLNDRKLEPDEPPHDLCETCRSLADRHGIPVPDVYVSSGSDSPARL
jgi:hypothetical protein